ncbi:MAG: hypothetical protein K2Y32_16270 [Candidatus Obscuribacterales bacterium]|nr:hypothetical protein [Candidatus Obscuribacterales bacterium]
MSHPKVIWSEEHQQFFIVGEAVSFDKLEEMYVESLRTGETVRRNPVHISSEEIRLALQNRHRQVRQQG